MESSGSRASIATFLLVAFGASIVLSLVVGLSGGAQSPYVSLGPVAMLFPALGVLVVRVVHRERIADLGWRRFPPRYLPVAVLLMPLAIHNVTLPSIFALERRLPWVEWLAPAADGLFHTPPERGWGDLTLAALAGRLLLNAIVGLVVVSVLAFFEEVGWRAWLLPRLEARLGSPKALAAGAAIWALWHTPFALSGIHAIQHVPTAAVVLLMPLGHFGAGLVIGWLWLRARSIVLVSLAHGALNNWGQFAFKLMSTDGRADLALLALLNSALLLVGLGVWWVGRRARAA